MTGTVYKSLGSWYRVKLSDHQVMIDARLRGNMRLEETKFTNPIAVGDLVELEEEDNDYVISKIYDRSNYIVRQSPKHRLAKHTIACNLDYCAVVATISQPRTSTGFIDRFLTVAEAYHIPAIIIINKMDLLKNKKKDLDTYHHWVDVYKSLGYEVIGTSSNTGEGLEKLKELLAGKRTLFSGHSGSGKSSILNHLDPSLNLKTGAISRIHQKGMHTTTYAEMYDSSTLNAQVIDTPGIKEFGVLSIEKHELRYYFVELARRLNQCKFQDCLHINEPECQVLKDLENGDIEYFRYQNYVNILENIDYQDTFYWEKN